MFKPSNLIKLLSEASADDQFNIQLDKIQRAIIKLESISDQYGPDKLQPVKSQLWALQLAAEDLKKIAFKMFGEDAVR